VQGLGALRLLAAVMSSTDALLVTLSESVSYDIPKSLNVALAEAQETWQSLVVMQVSASVAVFN